MFGDINTRVIPTFNFFKLKKIIYNYLPFNDNKKKEFCGCVRTIRKKTANLGVDQYRNKTKNNLTSQKVNVKASLDNELVVVLQNEANTKIVRFFN